MMKKVNKIIIQKLLISNLQKEHNKCYKDMMIIY